MPEKKGPGTNLGANTSRQTNLSALGGASDRTLTEERDARSAKQLERQEGRSISRDQGDDERPREV